MSTGSSLIYVSTGSGRSQRVADMPTPHLRNAIDKMEREVTFEYLANMPVYAAMKDELALRTKPRIVEAQGNGQMGRYTVQWRVIDGVLQVRHTTAGYGYRKSSDAWKPTGTLTRDVLVKLINLYDSPNGPEKI